MTSQSSERTESPVFQPDRLAGILWTEPVKLQAVGRTIVIIWTGEGTVRAGCQG